MSRITATLMLLVSAVIARADEPKPKGLLVIAPDRFKQPLGAFITHKKTLLPTELVSLEHALKSSQGADEPEQIKKYLFTAWKERNVGYVLLVGDADCFPVRYMVLDRATEAAFDYAFYPSDLYYADVAKPDGAFDDWNARKDSFHAGYFGEVRGEKNKNDPINFDAIDYRPELAVGRWPVSSAEEVSRIAEKTIRYEQAIVSGKRPNAARAAFFAVSGWVDSRSLMDELAKGLPSNWTAEKRYYGRKPAPSGSELLKAMNQGTGLILHAGHGTDDSWEGCINLSALLAGLKNADALPVIMSAGCSTARFATLPPYEAYEDIHGKMHKGTNAGEVFSEPLPPPATFQSGSRNGTGLGEGLLRRMASGAVAYIGCNTGSQPCALTLMAGFVKALNSQPEPRLGDCWSSAISYYYEREHLATIKPTADWYPASIFFQGMKFMVFGDPSLRLAGSGSDPHKP